MKKEKKQEKSEIFIFGFEYIFETAVMRRVWDTKNFQKKKFEKIHLLEQKN